MNSRHTRERRVPEDGRPCGGLNVLLDFSSNPLGGVLNNHLDTLHSDYAFVVATWQLKSLAHIAALDSADASPDWDFNLYPNPARDMLTVAFEGEFIKDVELLDVSGRRVVRYPNVNSPLLRIPTDQFARGVYWVMVAGRDIRKVKKVIFQ